jgi:hypothetical protein
MATMINIQDEYFDTTKYHLKSIAEQRHGVRSATLAVNDDGFGYH